MSARMIGAMLLAVGVFASPATAQNGVASSDSRTVSTVTVNAAPGRVENLVFTQAVPRLVVAQSFLMAVGQISERRDVVPVAGAIWTSSEPLVVSVIETGRVTGLREGKSVITATYKGQSVRVRVSVAEATSTAPVASLEITPIDSAVNINGALQYTHTARSSDGLVITTAPVGYVSRDTTIAQISVDGLLSARRSGDVSIVATSGTVSATAQMHVRAAVVTTSLSVLPAPMTVNAGDSSDVIVTGRRSDGSTVDPDQLTVRALRGRVSGGKYLAPTSAGADTIVVSALDGTTLSSLVTVMAPPSTNTPVVGTPSTRIALSLTRFDGGSGSVLVSSGVPLAPNQLRLGDVSKLRLVVNGNEVATRFTALKGLHRDGSLRSVLLQATVSIGSTPVAAELQIGVAPVLASPDAAMTVAKPVAMALPTGEHLRASMIVGPTRSIDSTSLSGYDSKFREFADVQWTLYGADWGMNYYDRVLNHVAFWSRGGESRYMRRALDFAVEYRQKYLVANDYLPSPHWSQLEGLAVHYWLTGDEASRTAVLNSARRLTDTFKASAMLDPSFEYNDGRIQARMLMASSLSTVLEGDPEFRTRAAAYVHAMVTNILPDGSYRWAGGEGQANFMVALQNDAMLKYIEWVADDARIAPTIKKTLDFIWSTQWIAASQAFRYSSSTTSTDAMQPAPDLSMFFVSAFAWYGRHSGDTSYRTKADAIALGAIAGAWLNGNKQFNQFFYSSYNYLAYRR